MTIRHSPGRSPRHVLLTSGAGGVAATATVIAMVCAAGASANASTHPSAAQSWRAAPVTSRAIAAVSAVSATDAWRVAAVQHGADEPVRDVTEHWDGTSWVKVAHPTPKWFTGLSALDARTTDDVWAVGETEDRQGNANPLAEHWGGHAWTVIQTPSDGLQDNLVDVSADAADDAWAVGVGYKGSKPVTGIAEHWDGTSWQLTALPPHVDGLTAVAAVSPRDTWAVGTDDLSPYGDDVVLHWDGSAWSIADSQPRADRLSHEYSSVVVLGDNDVWAIGTRIAQGRQVAHPRRPFSRHFDGSVWTNVPAAPGPDKLAGFYAAAPDGQGGLWAVGGSFAEYYDQQAPLIEHWDGTRWRVEPVPNLPFGSGLTDVAAASPTLAWAAWSSSRSRKPLQLVWNGSAWHR